MLIIVIIVYFALRERTFVNSLRTSSLLELSLISQVFLYHCFVLNKFYIKC